MSSQSHTSAAAIRPVAEPRRFDNVYSEDQLQRMFAVVRDNGPWKMILALHFDSPEEVAATQTGTPQRDGELSYDMFMTANFRGYFAQNGACLYPDDIEDCFLNPAFLKRVRAYWKADYAKPEMMLFNINGPCDSLDPAHLDGTEYRGIDLNNTPVWLMNTMSKSGLFNDWLMKKAQVISWNYHGNIGGGFTYWPDGLKEQPKRVAAPMWNTGVVVQNEQMYHRAEACGPEHLRKPEGLAFESLFAADPETADGWQITTNGEVIQQVSASETRFLIHWSAALYKDLDELRVVMDHSDDLTHEKVINMLIADMKKNGKQFAEPSDPLRDTDFISLLTGFYDPGAPLIYPPEAPGPFQTVA